MIEWLTLVQTGFLWPPSLGNFRKSSAVRPLSWAVLFQLFSFSSSMLFYRTFLKNVFEKLGFSVFGILWRTPLNSMVSHLQLGIEFSLCFRRLQDTQGIFSGVTGCSQVSPDRQNVHNVQLSLMKPIVFVDTMFLSATMGKIQREEGVTW